MFTRQMVTKAKALRQGGFGGLWMPRVGLKWSSTFQRSRALNETPSRIPPLLCLDTISEPVTDVWFFKEGTGHEDPCADGGCLAQVRVGRLVHAGDGW